MHVEQVEIYSDATNAAVLRHPGRRFPGVLVQGDTLYAFCRRADIICAAGRDRLSAQSYEELNELRNALQGLLAHYKGVLAELGVPLPFSEVPPSAQDSEQPPSDRLTGTTLRGQ